MKLQLTRMMPRWSVRARLIAACLAVELLATLALVHDSAHTLQAQQAHATQARARELAAVLGQAIAEPMAQRDYAAVHQLLLAVLEQQGVSYLDLTDHRGKPVARVGWPATQALPPRSSDVLNLDAADSTLHWGAQVKVAGQVLGRLDMGIAIGHWRQERQALLARGAGVGAVAMALSAALLAAIALAITRGLARLSHASHQFARGRYDTRLPALGRDELAQMARSFNAMADQVQQREQALQVHLQSARDERTRLATLLNAMQSGIVMLNAKGQVAYVNAAFKALWGLAELSSHEECKRLVQRLMQRAPRAAHPALAQLLADQAKDSSTQEYLTAEGRVVQQRVQALSEDIGGCIWFMRDVTEERQLAAQASQANTDALTGLLNRRGFEQALTAAMNSTEPLALITLDLDDFKLANDRGGHKLGDAVLVAVADCLRGHGAMAARLGGDEFALCLCGAAAEGAQEVAAAVVDEVCALSFRAGDALLHVGASVGMAQHPPRQGHLPAAADAAVLLDRADKAMYRAKRRGKNQWVAHAPTAPAPL